MRRRGLLAVVASSLAGGGCLESRTGSEPPPQNGTSAGGESPSERTESRTATETNRSSPVQWQASLGTRIPAPAVESGGVYTVSTSGVHAFDADDGTRRWTAASPQSATFPPAVDDGVVYVVGDRRLVAFDTASGAENWRYSWPDTVGIRASPTVGERAVVAGVSGRSTEESSSAVPEDVWAFDRQDGSLLWKRSLDTGARSGGPLSGRSVRQGETLYVQTLDGTALALDATDGSEQWRHEFDGTAVRGGPTLVAGEVLVVPVEFRAREGDARGTLVALETDDGRERWRVEDVQTAPVSDGTTVYGGRMSESGARSTVVALSATDGSTQWRFTEAGRLTRWSSLSAAGETLFVSVTERTDRGGVRNDESTLYAIDPDGDERWRFERRCEGFSRVVVAEGTVYVAGRFGDGTLYALTP